MDHTSMQRSVDTPNFLILISRSCTHRNNWKLYYCNSAKQYDKKNLGALETQLVSHDSIKNGLKIQACKKICNVP